MEWVELLLGSGLLLTTGGWLITLGQHKQKHENLQETLSTIKSDMEKVVNRVDKHDTEISDGKIINATILAELRHLSQQMDNFDKKLDKLGG